MFARVFVFKAQNQAQGSSVVKFFLTSAQAHFKILEYVCM